MSGAKLLSLVDRDIIPAKYAGRGAVFQGDNYFDLYLSYLECSHPLNRVLGERRQDILEKKPDSIYHYMQGCESIEEYHILSHILSKSAIKGFWQPKVITSSQYASYSLFNNAKDFLNQIIEEGKTPNEINATGIKQCLDKGNIQVANHDNKILVIPSQAFIEYISQLK